MKHVLRQGDLKRSGLNPKDKAELAAMIKDIFDRAQEGFVKWGNGRLLIWDEKNRWIVIINLKMPDRSTVFSPDKGVEYFEEQTASWWWRGGES